VHVRQIDAANNVSPTTSFSFTLDRSRPTAPQVVPAQLAGINPYAIVTRDPSLSVRRVERHALVEYSIQGRAGWSNWSTEYSPVAGRNVVRARQIDLAGNVSAASRALAFRLDTTTANASLRSLPAKFAQELPSLAPTAWSRRSGSRPSVM